MNLVKRNYSNGFPTAMDELFKDLLGGTQYTHKAVPPVNIRETEQVFTIDLAAPGLKKEDFKLELDKGLLSISHQAETEKTEQPEGKFTRKEFAKTSFKRAFTLPETVNEADINAVYQDGILTITLPKKEVTEAESKRAIEIL